MLDSPPTITSRCPMRRIGLAVVVAVSLTLEPLAAEAQEAKKVPRIGVLNPGILTPQTPGGGAPAALREGLRELGYVESQNIIIEWRYAMGKAEQFPVLAAELVRLKADVIVAASDPVIAAAQRATTSIPIVMSNASDPVARGFVASLARPGGNTTGLTIQTPEIAGKNLELLKEAVPGLARVAVLWDPGFPGGRPHLSEAEAAARTLGVQLQPVGVRSPEELDGAFAAVIRDNARAAALIAGSPMLMGSRARLAELAVKHRLPTVCPLREYVEAGCLIGYGSSLTYQFRRAAYFVDRILKGAKPADLPVEQPTKFELVINPRPRRPSGSRSRRRCSGGRTTSSSSPCSTHAANSCEQLSASRGCLARSTTARSMPCEPGSTPGLASDASLPGCIARASTFS